MWIKYGCFVSPQSRGVWECIKVTHTFAIVLKIHSKPIWKELNLNFALSWRGFVPFWSKSQIQNFKFTKFRTIQVCLMKSSQRWVRSTTRLKSGTVVTVSNFSYVDMLYFGLFQWIQGSKQVDLETNCLPIQKSTSNRFVTHNSSKPTWNHL